MKYPVFLSLLMIFATAYADSPDLDRCSTTGENPMWQIVQDNQDRITEDKLVQDQAFLPGDVFSNAVEYGYQDLVSKLLEDPIIVKLHGGDALSAAAGMGKIGMSRFLIEHGISPNAKNDLGTTALWVAVQFGCTDELEFLIIHGAKVNFKIERDHNTPMIEAIMDHHYETSALLLKNGYRVRQWELEKIKMILFRQGDFSVWDYLFSKLEVKPSSAKSKDQR